MRERTGQCPNVSMDQVLYIETLTSRLCVEVAAALVRAACLDQATPSSWPRSKPTLRLNCFVSSMLRLLLSRQNLTNALDN